MSDKYNHQQIEQKWQNFWLNNKTFKAEINAEKQKFYALDMFPFPSGAGLHVGHPLGYTATDIICRKKRMDGLNVLHPMGWDAFGLPAENYAIKTGVHPSVSTGANIDNFRRQIQSLGFSYDWDREVDTSQPEYYRWSQWLFLQMYKRGLLYEKKMPMNWCPQCKIVAANEEVEQGTHERCGAVVERRNLRQWMFRITEYAERLLGDLDDLPEWPEKIKAMQRNWIGKSEGAEIDFTVDGMDEKIRVYTTRPDTLFGATYFVLSPEHPLVDELTTEDQWQAVEEYRTKCAAKSELERTELNKNKSGVFTGGYVINPANGEKLPVWIADYVLMTYGTGAIMAVPAHDERDHEFAEKYDLPIKQVVDGLEDPFQKNGGKIINSDFLNGLSVEKAIDAMVAYLEEKNLGYKKVNYKLRDWIFTRQRYWGEPIPLVFDEAGECYPLDDSELPLVLPDTPNYEPSADGQSPLAKITDWVNVSGMITEQGTVITKNIPADAETKNFRRETSTMPNWAGSNWYWLRYMDAKNSADFCSKDAEQYWGPVDLYVGGAEHAVLHLLYSRFWHKVLFDMGLVSTKEPFKKLVNQGLIMAEDGEKMSKSKGNVVNPDEIVEKFGADTLRCYEMFMGPFEQSKAWNGGAVSGVRKWLDRVWRVFEKDIVEDEKSAEKILPTLHKTIKTVGEHIDEFKFNTAISQLMVLTNELTGLEKIPRKILETYTLLLAPFAPHLAEECWAKLGNDDTIAYESWPEYDEKYLVEDVITYAVQVNGKVRADFQMEKSAEKSAVLSAARELPNVAKYLNEGEIKKEIFVPEKIVGFVVK